MKKQYARLRERVKKRIEFSVDELFRHIDLDSIRLKNQHRISRPKR